MNEQRQQRQLSEARVWVALLVAGLVFIGLPTASGLAAGTPPKVSVGEIGHDFGKVVEDQRLIHTFVIKNDGGQPLIIEDVDPDCSCTAADYDRTISPGAEGKITLAIKPYSVMHQFKKQTRVRFNDPDKPLVVFTMMGVAQPFIEIKPSHIIRFRGSPGDNLQAQVHFISHLSSPFKITGFRTNITDKIEVSLKEEEPDKAYVLTVKNLRREGGAYGGIIEIFTNSKQRPRLVVRVFGELYMPAAGNP